MRGSLDDIESKSFSDGTAGTPCKNLFNMNSLKEKTYFEMSSI